MGVFSSARQIARCILLPNKTGLPELSDCIVALFEYSAIVWEIINNIYIYICYIYIYIYILSLPT